MSAPSHKQDYEFIIVVNDPIKLGVSACLLGERVRHDGDHKRNGYIVDELSRYFEFVPVCPEVAIGLGVPRPAIHLVGTATAPRALGVTDPSLNVTARLRNYGRRQGQELSGLSGYILKSASPSCGIAGVKIHSGRGKTASGIYACALMEKLPLLPAVEERDLIDPHIRGNFIERVFAYRRWQMLLRTRLTPAKLIEFHSVHKLELMAHCDALSRALGRSVARVGRGSMKKFSHEYAGAFMAILATPATVKRHANVLLHALGYFKGHISAAEKKALLRAIDDFRHGRSALLAPILLLQRHLARFPVPYLAQQTYLNPHPYELRLRYAD